jgi:ribosomal protein S12 methylthiotransferase
MNYHVVYKQCGNIYEIREIPMKILFVSLGCDKNLVDSEFMLGLLEEAGYHFTDEETEADIIIINTCCFINDAKEESIQAILAMAEHKEHGHLKALIVTGCLAQRYQDEIQTEIPQVDAILGTNAKADIIVAINNVFLGRSYKNYNLSAAKTPVIQKRLRTTGGHYAHLKIAEGCNKGCTYCIIPQIRGNYRSVPIEELVAQATQLVHDGAKELILVAQETTLYGLDLYGKKSLPNLLDALNKIPALHWIRIMYCYPEEIDEPLIQAIKRNEKVCRYLDIPIQHISNHILTAMGRKTTMAQLTDKISFIRREIPNIALRTTIICGFPGETEDDHEELMYFINETEFDRLGAFCYSPEEGTAAATFPHQINEEQKAAWQEDVMVLQQEIIFDKNETLIGMEMTVMIEGRLTEEQAYVGRTYRDAPDIDGYVFIHTNEELMSGDFVNVRIIEASNYDLIGEII